MRVNQKVVVKSAATVAHEPAANQTLSSAATFRRLISCALLGENQFYVNGQDLMAQIDDTAKNLPLDHLMREAHWARTVLGLRHTPLFILNHIVARKDRTPDDSGILQVVIQNILRTPRDAMDLVALYFAGGKKPLPHAYKKAISEMFSGTWTPYQLAKYATLKNVSVRLRDLMALTHPKPQNNEQILQFNEIWHDTIRAPDTWESLLSVPGADKRRVWETLLSERRIGALAIVRNLRNMEQVGVNHDLVRTALNSCRATDVWPWQALAAAQQAPGYAHELSDLMIRSAMSAPRIPGNTFVLVDVSGSMNDALNARGTMLRRDAATGLAAILREVGDVEIATFSNEVVHLGPLPRGVNLAHKIVTSQRHAGTRLGEAIRSVMASHGASMDRLVVITDEQSQTTVQATGVPTYVLNVASYQRGVNWNQNVTRIDGWSGGIVNWLAQEITGEIVATVEEDEDN